MRISKFIYTMGESSAPYVNDGDFIWVQFGDFDPKLGMLVLFDAHGLLVCHRLVAMRRRGRERLFRTQGDNKIWPDRWQRLGDLKGFVMDETRSLPVWKYRLFECLFLNRFAPRNGQFVWTRRFWKGLSLFSKKWGVHSAS